MYTHTHAHNILSPRTPVPTHLLNPQPNPTPTNLETHTGKRTCAGCLDLVLSSYVRAHMHVATATTVDGCVSRWLVDRLVFTLRPWG